MRSPFESYRGHDLEIDLIGKEVVPAARYDGTYLAFNEAVELVERSQPEGWKPEDPPAGFVGDLHYTARELLPECAARAGERHRRLSPPARERIRTLITEGTLRAFTALKSTLDVKHGVDIFFSFKVSNEPEVLATVDVTENPAKEGGYKADVVVSFPPEHPYADLSLDERREAVSRYGREVAQIIVDKLANRELDRLRASA